LAIEKKETAIRGKKNKEVWVGPKERELAAVEGVANKKKT